MTTYTIINSVEAQSGLSLEDAARELLLEDGAEYDIREAVDGAGFELWHRKPNANKPWTKTVIYSIEDDRDAAETDIFKKVIDSGYWEGDDLSCMTDERYAEMLAESE